MADSPTPDVSLREKAERALAGIAEAVPMRDGIPGGRRCSVEKSDAMDGWWVGVSPRNGYGAMVEGPWEDWVEIARGISGVTRDEATELAEAVIALLSRVERAEADSGPKMERAVSCRLTGFDVRPKESPDDVRFTVNVPYSVALAAHFTIGATMILAVAPTPEAPNAH